MPKTKESAAQADPRDEGDAPTTNPASATPVQFGERVSVTASAGRSAVDPSTGLPYSGATVVVVDARLLRLIADGDVVVNKRHS